MSRKYLIHGQLAGTGGRGRPDTKRFTLGTRMARDFRIERILKKEFGTLEEQKTEKMHPRITLGSQLRQE